MESISYHITPLVNNSLGGGHTYTHTHTHAHTHTHMHANTYTDDPHKFNFKKPGARRPQAGAHLV